MEKKGLLDSIITIGAKVGTAAFAVTWACYGVMTLVEVGKSLKDSYDESHAQAKELKDKLDIEGLEAKVNECMNECKASEEV